MSELALIKKIKSDENNNGTTKVLQKIIWQKG